MSHVSSRWGGFEGGLGSVGSGQRQRVGLGDVCVRAGFSRCVPSIRQLVPLLFFSKLRAHKHTHTPEAVLIFDVILHDLG